MWFSVYDVQHTFQQLVTDPKLYSIGLQNTCFSTKVFFQNIVEAIVNAYFLFLFCFYGEDGVVVSNKAKNGYFWIDGTIVYAAVVLIVNLKIVHKTNNHTWLGTLWLVLSVVLFWVWLALESSAAIFPDVYKTFK